MTGKPILQTMYLLAALACCAVWIAACGSGDSNSSAGGDPEYEGWEYDIVDNNDNPEAEEDIADEEESSDVPADIDEVEPEMEEEIEEEADSEPELEPEWPEIPEEFCVPGTRACYADGRKLKICNTDGESYTRVLCADDEICYRDDCYPYICDAGQVTCEQGNVVECNELGIRYTLSELCRGSMRCNEAACSSACGAAQVIEINQLIYGSTLDRENLLEADSHCWSPETDEAVVTTGLDVVYAIDLVEGQSIRVKVTPTTEHFDPAVYLFEDCDTLPDSCLTGSDNCCAGDSDEFRFTAPRDGRFYIAVDSYNEQGGEFSLKISLSSSTPADISISGLTRAYDVETNTLTLSATVRNIGSLESGGFSVGAYLSEDEDPEAGGTPYAEKSMTSLAPGEQSAVEFVFPKAARGSYSAVLVADWSRKLYEADRSNNSVGPMEFEIQLGPTEYSLDIPTRREGRIFYVDEEVYYRFPCIQDQVLLLEVRTDNVISNLEAKLWVLDIDGITELDSNDGRGGGSPDPALVFTCPSTGRYRMKVARSPTAYDEERTGPYEIIAVGLNKVAIDPESVTIFPNRTVRAYAQGVFDEGFTDYEPNLGSNFITWRSLDEEVATVYSTGLIRASGAVHNGLTYILAETPDPTVPPGIVEINVTTAIPGEIFVSTDEFPIYITDNDAENWQESTINVTEDFTIADVNVAISITHDQIKELEFVLESPAGTQVTLLKNKSGTNLVTIFDLLSSISGPGSLDDFTGENAKGTWRLLFHDDEARNKGRLNIWRLYLDKQ